MAQEWGLVRLDHLRIAHTNNSWSFRVIETSHSCNRIMALVRRSISTKDMKMASGNGARLSVVHCILIQDPSKKCAMQATRIISGTSKRRYRGYTASMIVVSDQLSLDETRVDQKRSRMMLVFFDVIDMSVRDNAPFQSRSNLIRKSSSS